MKVTIYTDGAAKGNPDGPGGYGTILEYTDTKGQVHRRELSCGYVKTTNNRMELMAAIAGLEALLRPCDVTLYSDSKYLVDAFNKKWIDYWKVNGWRKKDRSPVKNTDLWERLLSSMEDHNVEFVWVKGHDGNENNERCDQLATSAAQGDELINDEGIEEQ